MLISFNGQQTGDIHIPPFSLSDGEIAIMSIPAGTRQQEIRSLCTEVLLSLTQHGIKTETPFMYVDGPQQSLVGRLFNPMSVKDYIRKHANLANSIAQLVYDLDDEIYPRHRMNALSSLQLKMVTLYTALSWTNRIILDLYGLDEAGAHQLYDVMKQYAAIGGASFVLTYDQAFGENGHTFIPVTTQEKIKRTGVV